MMGIVIAGIWAAAQTLHIGDRWFHYIVAHHPGIVAFLVLDIIIIIAATNLTIVQASQVTMFTVFLINGNHYCSFVIIPKSQIPLWFFVGVTIESLSFHYLYPLFHKGLGCTRICINFQKTLSGLGAHVCFLVGLGFWQH